jgi:hypothetical protein
MRAAGAPTSLQAANKKLRLTKNRSRVLMRQPSRALAREGLIETKRTVGRERCGVGLHLAYWVAQVRHADARDHRRVAKDGWRASQVVKESNAGAKQHRRDVDADFVEEASIQQLLDGVSAVDPNGLPGGGGFGLAHGAFDAVGHEVDR